MYCIIRNFTLFIIMVSLFSCKKKEEEPAAVSVSKVTVNTVTLTPDQLNTNIAVNASFTIIFSAAVDPLSASSGITLKKNDNTTVKCNMTFYDLNKTIILKPQSPLENQTLYNLVISSVVKGGNNETVTPKEYRLKTVPGEFTVSGITINGVDFQTPNHPNSIDFEHIKITINFSDTIQPVDWAQYFSFYPVFPFSLTLSLDGKSVEIANISPVKDFSKYFLSVLPGIPARSGASFAGFNNFFYTRIDSVPKFPVISDEELLTLIQERTFRYFYDFVHPSCGMALERNSSGDIVTSGGSGFGVMALIVGMERGFITREQGLARLDKILLFLENCDRFHGAWPHWLNGKTGKVVPFSTNDNGADLVETSYMAEGLITMRQYLNPAQQQELMLINRITALCDAIEYDWFTRGQNVLYWHWSPDYGWIMNMQIRGYNETLITYVMASTSTTHPVSATVYTQGYAGNGSIKNGNSYYGIKLPLGEAYGGPLFFTHYSFLGLNPHQLQDQFANYWEQNVNQSLINMTYCKQNPKKQIGFSDACWGLTASDNPWGYNAHSPTNDLGVITPTAAVSALPYTPAESMRAIRFFYYTLGDHLWGDRGFYDAFCPNEGWWASSTLAIDQGPMICMIENYRSALLWNLFMSAPEVQAGLTKFGFTYQKNH